MISPIIISAVNILQKRFPEIDFIILSKEMYRLSPESSAPAGRLGVTLYINGYKVFFGCESMAEEICGPFGRLIADDFVHNVLYNSNK